MRWCLLAVVAVSLLSLSVPAKPAQAEKHARTEDGTFSQHLRGTDVRPEVATPVGKARDLMSPEMADEEKAHPKTTHGRNRRSVTQWRSSSSLFNQRLGTGSKLLLTVSLLAGAALTLKRLGGALWKCLAEVGGLEPRDGSTPRSLSSLPSSGACERLLGEIAESHGDDVRLESQSPSLALRPSGFTPNLMLVTIVLFAVIAMSLAGPPPTTRTDAEDMRMPLEGSAEDEKYGSDDPEEMDDTPPPVEVKGKKVTIGKDWRNQDGTLKQGRRITFDYGGKKYRVFLTKAIQAALNADEQRAVISALRAGPRREQENRVYVWGENTPGSILAFQSELPLGEQDITVKVYLPEGVFGLSDNDDRLDTDDDAQGFFDLWDLVYALMHVMVTGEKPPLLEE